MEDYKFNEEIPNNFKNNINSTIGGPEPGGNWKETIYELIKKTRIINNPETPVKKTLKADHMTPTKNISTCPNNKKLVVFNTQKNEKMTIKVENSMITRSGSKKLAKITQINEPTAFTKQKTEGEAMTNNYTITRSNSKKNPKNIEEDIKNEVKKITEPEIPHHASFKVEKRKKIFFEVAHNKPKERKSIIRRRGFAFVSRSGYFLNMNLFPPVDEKDGKYKKTS